MSAHMAPETDVEQQGRGYYGSFPPARVTRMDEEEPLFGASMRCMPSRLRNIGRGYTVAALFGTGFLLLLAVGLPLHASGVISAATKTTLSGLHPSSGGALASSSITAADTAAAVTGGKKTNDAADSEPVPTPPPTPLPTLLPTLAPTPNPTMPVVVPAPPPPSPAPADTSGGEPSTPSGTSPAAPGAATPEAPAAHKPNAKPSAKKERTESRFPDCEEQFSGMHACETNESEEDDDQEDTDQEQQSSDDGDHDDDNSK
mmetsp:Transcript_24204/g.33836  ORF Transcript_24204/g.33836 Transcript_24204/m.33836 type:complete len:259 (-) Transcript_24204:223-999(-)